MEGALTPSYGIQVPDSRIGLSITEPKTGGSAQEERSPMPSVRSERTARCRIPSVGLSMTEPKTGESAREERSPELLTRGHTMTRTLGLVPGTSSRSVSTLDRHSSQCSSLSSPH